MNLRSNYTVTNRPWESAGWDGWGDAYMNGTQGTVGRYRTWAAFWNDMLFAYLLLHDVLTMEI